MGNSNAASDFEEETRVRSEEESARLARHGELVTLGMADGEEDGLIYGPRSAGALKLALYYARPELPAADRAAYEEGFFRGLRVGIAQRNREAFRDYCRDSHLTE